VPSADWHLGLSDPEDSDAPQKFLTCWLVTEQHKTIHLGLSPKALRYYFEASVFSTSTQPRCIFVSLAPNSVSPGLPGTTWWQKVQPNSLKR
jgi:hypothetical protein